MPRIIVCSLSKLDEFIDRFYPSHVISLLGPDDMIDTPPGIRADKHLQLGFNDIGEPMPGYHEPLPVHVEGLIDFANNWDQTSPLLIHCWAGVSRSTAAAYIIWCHLNKEQSNIAHKGAAQLRRLSPTATPNPLLVRHADDMMRANGTMISAIASIGRGQMTSEGHPFEWEIKQ